MMAASRPAHAHPTVAVSGTTQVSGPPLTAGQTLLVGVGLVFLLWVAYRIGRIVLRVVAGTVFLALLVFGIWYFLIK
jgi:hypothetical protein